MSQTDGSEARNVLITGLKNAHAMEKQALSMMGPQVDRIENYPEVKERLVQHAKETEGQALAPANVPTFEAIPAAGEVNATDYAHRSRQT